LNFGLNSLICGWSFFLVINYQNLRWLLAGLQSEPYCLQTSEDGYFWLFFPAANIRRQEPRKTDEVIPINS
jgi:hypothetical protein